ncbi:MAG TPA: hypothetical protein VGM08_04910 [Candidatus Saccharimonadales bacterium]|jgi:hypothetical protein
MQPQLGQHDRLNVLLIPVIVLAVLFVGVGSFAVWAYSGRQDYKDNVDTKISSAVGANKQAVQAADAARYAEAAKNPLTTYTGPDAYGSVKVSYPRTWSAYVDTTDSGTPLNAYFHAGYVPSINSQQTYNLRVQVNSQSYSTILAGYSGQVQSGKITSAPYTLPKVPSIVGTILTGAVVQNQLNGGSGTMVLIPLRNTTLEIWTESNSYLADFNTYILPNLTFSP